MQADYAIKTACTTTLFRVDYRIEISHQLNNAEPINRLKERKATLIAAFDFDLPTQNNDSEPLFPAFTCQGEN